jgi:hypothetical protein
MAEQEMDKQEQERIIQIALDYFKKETGSDKKAQEMLGKVATIVKDEGAKLVHLGNVLFLVMVRGKGVVEIHTIGTEAQPRMLAEDFKQLAPMLKDAGASVTVHGWGLLPTFAESMGFPVIPLQPEENHVATTCV